MEVPRPKDSVGRLVRTSETVLDETLDWRKYYCGALENVCCWGCSMGFVENRVHDLLFHLFDRLLRPDHSRLCVGPGIAGSAVEHFDDLGSGRLVDAAKVFGLHLWYLVRMSDPLSSS